MNEELKRLQIRLGSLAKVLMMDGKEGLCGFNGIAWGIELDGGGRDVIALMTKMINDPVKRNFLLTHTIQKILDIEEILRSCEKDKKQVWIPAALQLDADMSKCSICCCRCH
jgi:hypothetical protein